MFKADGRFEQMDFPTRNLYRSAVEHLARGSGLTELETAHAAVAVAARAGPPDADGPDARLSDPGYYLIAGGRPRFEAEIGYHPPPHVWPGRIYRACGIGGYVSAGAVVAAALLAIPLSIAVRTGVGPAWVLMLGVLGLIPAVDLAVAAVNLMITRGFRATLLPALDLSAGVPAHLRTLVAVPTLLTSIESVEDQIGSLEIHHLASPRGDLHFALLSDWTDAEAEHAKGDEALLDAARAAIARLNQRYGPAPGGDRFLLLHRRRVWNETEGCWLGWERKRGKLCELNRLLRGAHGHHLSWTRPPCPRASATWSPWTRTRGCRATRSGGSSARWPIRSTGRAWTRRWDAWWRATPSSSRG